ncbi:MAG TPA: T9SS type A sorting domain-containing protein [Mucilaginibacter sp.]|nr:T9SS type A sorting domain-containing protein [Mucilaginibacter sp.]
MRQNFTKIFSWTIIIAVAISMYCVRANAQKADTTLNLHLQKGRFNPQKSSYLKNGLHLALPPLKPASTSAQKVSVIRPDDKLLTDVQVYPNPVTDQVTVKYLLTRNAIVTVKVMDVLGNDVVTLVPQRIASGEQTFSYPLGSKLQRGFYFIRVVAGTESVIKRISVL